LAGRSLSASDVFAALSDAQRLRLLKRLSDGERHSISELSNGAGVTRQAVTRHLRVLEGARLVRGKRDGREHLWSLDEAGLAAAQSELDAIARAWRTKLARLKRLVEE